ncbi:MAG: serine hydrolase, partial [Pseudomonadota bacterium]
QPEIGRSYVRSGPLAESDLDVDVPTDGSDLDTFIWVNSEGLGDAPIHTTPADMNTFIRTLLGTDTLLSEELRTRMMTESFPGQSGHGLGLFIFNDGPEFQHGGTAFGMNTLMSYFPSMDASFATMVNASFDDFDDLYNDYLQEFYRVLQEDE